MLKQQVGNSLDVYAHPLFLEKLSFVYFTQPHISQWGWDI